MTGKETRLNLLEHLVANSAQWRRLTQGQALCESVAANDVADVGLVHVHEVTRHGFV